MASSFIEANPRIRGGVNFNYFYAELSPYGEWIEIDRNVIVWRPYHVSYSWQPYTRGRWEYTAHGWYWDSFEPFGWATYHYGRWFNDDYYGWVWMPGYEWGPSWVEWRYNDVYVGWAPLPPYAEFRVSVGIHFSINWHSHYRHWNFIAYNRFCGYDVSRYIIHNRYNSGIFNKTKYRTNYYQSGNRIINGGVDRSYVQRRAGFRIAERELDYARSADDYRKSRNDGRNVIKTYVPDDDNLKRVRTVEKFDIKSSRTRTSLKTDKITQRSSSVEVESRSQTRVPSRAADSKQNVRNQSRTEKNYQQGAQIERFSSRKDAGKVNQRSYNRNEAPQVQKRSNTGTKVQRETISRAPATGKKSVSSPQKRVNKSVQKSVQKSAPRTSKAVKKRR